MFSMIGETRPHWMRAVCWFSLYVVYTLEVLIGYGFLLYRGHYDILASCLLFTCFTLVLNQVPIEKRVGLQRRVLGKIRNTVFLGQPLSKEFDFDVWERREGWKLACLMTIPSALVLFLSDASKGEIWFALKHFRSGWYFICAYYLGGRADMVYSARCLVCEQVISLVLFGRVELQRRAVISRFAVSVSFFESFDEVLIQMLPVSVWLGSPRLPLSLLMFFIIPCEVFGIRSLIVAKLSPVAPGSPMSPSLDPNVPRVPGAPSHLAMLLGEKRYAASEYFFYTLIVIPMGVMTFSLGQYLSAGDNNKIVPIAQSVLFAACGLILYVEHESVRATFSLVSPRSSTSTRTSAELYFAWIATLLVAVSFGNVWGITVTVVFTLGWITVSSRGFRIRYQRWMLLLTQLLFLLVSPKNSISTDFDAASLLLTLARASLVSDETSTLDELGVDFTVSTAIHLVLMVRNTSSTTLSGEVNSSTSVTLLTLCTLLIALANACSKESQNRLYQAVRKSENFLDHAVKQKYSGVGTALEAILDSFPGSVYDPKLAPLKELLSGALLECHMGRDICHMSAMVRKAALCSSEVKANIARTTICLEALLSDWRGYHIFQVTDSSSKLDDLGDLLLHSDKDLLRALLTSLRKGESQGSILNIRKRELGSGGAFVLELSLQRSIEATQQDVRISKHSCAPKPFLCRIQQNVAELLNVEIANQATVLIRFNASREQVHPSAWPQTMPSWPNISSRGATDVTPNATLSSIPVNLTVAILDDNHLVRSNLMRIVTRRLNVNVKTTFGWGNTVEEALRFPQEIISRKVDIAIFDENLEYDLSKTNPHLPVRVSGRDLAVTARERGFMGCIVLHSANGDLQAGIRIDVIDGFIEKTAKQQDFVDSLTKIWNRYSSMQQNHTKLDE